MARGRFGQLHVLGPGAATSVRAHFETPENAAVAATGTTSIEPRVVQRIFDAH